MASVEKDMGKKHCPIWRRIRQQSFNVHILRSAILFLVGYPKEIVPHVLQVVETRIFQDIINVRKL